MHKFLVNRWHGMHNLYGLIVMTVLDIGLFIYQWVLGVVGLAMIGGVVYFAIAAEKAFRKDLDNYVMTLSHRVKHAGNAVINELPLGILLYNEEKIIEWHNPFIAKIADRETAVGASLLELFPDLKNKKEKDAQAEIHIGDHIYKVIVRADERLLYFYDTTEHVVLQKRYLDEKLAVGIVALDNLDEVTQGMEDQTRAILSAKVTGEINDWAHRNHIYLRRIASDKYMILLNQKTLSELEQNRFEIIDDVRELTEDHKLPLTLSIGIAAGADELIELGQMAQSSLDIALGRGGDQVAVKVGQRLSFYGGKSNAVEKRTRVRARVISHALRDLIKESDNVIISGHRVPDMDSIGAAIGVLKAVQLSGKQGYIVLEEVNPSIERLMLELAGSDDIYQSFVSPEQALDRVKGNSLVVIVDTHKASMMADPRLLQQSNRIVVIDHHRRGEEFIEKAVLVYIEPYASSTCELVTELLQYFHEQLKLEVLEATSLLAGIVVDTKSFSLRTGSRTFEAASFLRRNGADSALIQRLLKENISEYVQKAEIIKHAEVLYEHVALAVTEPKMKYSQLLIAKVADTLLNMTNILASFVISELPDGRIGVSARSLGQINVQVVMEKMGGGGHLTNAATQIDGTLEDARQQLKTILAEMESEEGLFE